MTNCRHPPHEGATLLLYWLFRSILQNWKYFGIWPPQTSEATKEPKEIMFLQEVELIITQFAKLLLVSHCYKPGQRELQPPWLRKVWWQIGMVPGGGNTGWIIWISNYQSGGDLRRVERCHEHMWPCQSPGFLASGYSQCYCWLPRYWPGVWCKVRCQS